MIKLKKILLEILNNFQVEAVIVSDKKTNISTILDQIRGLHKVTIVSNITPENYVQTNPNSSTYKIKIKFVTREDPNKDVIQLKKDMTTTDLSPDHKHFRVSGLKSVTFKPETIKRI
tara:strand:- start:824 stop:1174 length:351 start_codon:yes stop_codon:yes gene_type:complete